MTEFWRHALSLAGLGAVGCYVYWSLMKRILPTVTGHPLNQKQTFYVVVLGIFGLLIALISVLLTYYMTSNPIPARVKEKASLQPSVPYPEAITFLPIDHLQDRLERLAIPTDSPTIRMRLISEKFKVDHSLTVSLKAQPRLILEKIVEQLALDLHLKVDLTRFPHPDNCVWWHHWILMLDGAQFPEHDPRKSPSTLEQLGIKEGAIIRIRVEWMLICELSGPITEPQETVPPPNIDL